MLTRLGLIVLYADERTFDINEWEVLQVLAFLEYTKFPVSNKYPQILQLVSFKYR